MRYDLSFFLCCCKSFLGDHQNTGEPDFYDLLQVERDASPEELKRAYKRQSLQMHPDKLAQRGQAVTDADQAKFTRMKEAYEVLSDPHKRATYDAIGEKGMKWMEEPFSIDPQELAHNFATSSVLDRSKIFAIFVALAVALLIQPILICLHVDGKLGPEASWVATLLPLWMWDAFILFYHTRVILMGPVPRPDSIPPEEWVDPLPMKKRILSMTRFVLIVLVEFLVALKLDQLLSFPWTLVFLPLYLWEASTIYKKWPLARMRIVTVSDLETALGKPFTEFTPAEKELIASRYSVVPTTDSPDFDAAQKLKTRARHDIVKSGFRVLFVCLLLWQLDANLGWNWWLIFAPFWIMTGLICFANYQAFAQVHREAALKDPTLFGTTIPPPTTTGNTTTTDYGAVGENGTATPDQAQKTTPTTTLTDEQREELKAQVMASSGKLCSKCCSQGFLLFIVCLVVGKIQGAGYSAFWIISPFLIAAGLILSCLGCAIFGITEVPTNGVEFDAADFAYTNAEEGTAPPTTAAATTPIYVPPPEPVTPVVVVPPVTPVETAPVVTAPLQQRQQQVINLVHMAEPEDDVEEDETPDIVNQATAESYREQLHDLD